LLHDFGTVLPGQVCRNRFVLTNPTATTWTFAKLIPSCSCTVASTTAPAIAPGKSESVEVEYKSPPSNQDDRRKVGVQFAEAGAPTFWLEVQARIRQPICLFPEALTLSQIGRDGSESFFDVHNYTTKPIQLDTPRCSVPWLEASMNEVQARPPGVIQVWRVVVRAKIAGMKPGQHRGDVLVAASGAGFKKAVPVDLELIAPIRPIPNRLFFGSLTRGVPVERKISLLLSADLAHLMPEDIKVEHDLGERLRVLCSRTSPTRLELAATLTLSESDNAEINGTVHLAFRDPALPPISLPVIATVGP